MGFNSIDFAIFFPLVTGLYFLCPQRFRWALLLLASCWFYMSLIPAYIFILLFTICVDYVAGLAIERSTGVMRRNFLIASILANGGTLFFFKYFNFFEANITSVAQFFHWNLPLETLAIVLPIGLSFHVFQSISYTIEVYRGNQKAEGHFGIFALYVMFYPQLVAGPIERPQNLLHQFHERHRFNLARASSGLGLMLFGYVKKLVIADNLAVFVDQVYNHPSEYMGMSIVFATIFFAFQVYCDFSGYSDIARGAARVMGFSLMENFRRPYFSQSIGEFWRRWHISLSSWIRDYIFMPLAVKWRHSRKWGVTAALLVAFLFSGLWHGANWTFIVWGLILGIAISIEFLTGGGRTLSLTKEPRNIWKILRTFLLFCFSLVFFRASTITAALGLLKNIFAGWGTLFPGQSLTGFLGCILSIILLVGVEYFEERELTLRLFMMNRYHFGTIFRVVLVVVGLLSIIFFTPPQSPQFIYFQF